MVYRIHVEKKEGFREDAEKLRSDIVNLLEIKSLTGLRIFNRYDVENIDEALFNAVKTTVFSEPQVDDIYDTLECIDGCFTFAVEYLPGQFDQRADSAAQCIEIISKKKRPTIRSSKVYALYGDLTNEEKTAIKNYVINPVEAREASLIAYNTLEMAYEVPTEVETLDGFIDLDKKGLSDFVKSYGLAMDLDDIAFCQDYFKKENRNPTVTEIRMIDTYWSDHCRHTTFLTTVDKVTFEDKTVEAAYKEYLADRAFLNRTKPVNLMDIATLATRLLRKLGKLDKLDESEEINACTVKMTIDVDGKAEDWLLLFKNETHNHPTEIEPFGGAATCIGGAIRDPLSGRSYVYSAMRVTGAADPLRPVKETMKGKLPQRKIVTTAANGYSSYGNQIGLATGFVDELYHDGYAAKRMEIGAVVAAAPAANVRRECPAPDDVVILLGGRTGRDGCGGATGSSKSHTLSSLTTCGAEVQKGNAPEERKLQRLFRNGEATRLIKRCNDFGAGGVSVAIGELADGLTINLNAVPKKYEGLDGTELAISESQERMAVVVAPEDVEKFKALADSENLEATVVATVTEEKRLVMHWNGKKIVDIDREFLNSNGAEKHIEVAAAPAADYQRHVSGNFKTNYNDLVGDLNVCSKRGLIERFDSTIGAGTVLMPFGGKYQATPIQAMCQKVSVEKGVTNACSLMAYGYNPYVTEKSPYHGAYLAVVESVTRLMAAGAPYKDVYLTFQEYFEKPMRDAHRWGKPLSALLGAYKAQKELGIASIGGKDSMSGSFENIDVPPTLVSFAVTVTETDKVLSPEFKEVGSRVVIIEPDYDENGLPTAESLIRNYQTLEMLNREKKLRAAYAVGFGGIAEAVFKMAIGNRIGFLYRPNLSIDYLFGYRYGAVVCELCDAVTVGTEIGVTVADEVISREGECLRLSDLTAIYEEKLEPVFPTKARKNDAAVENYSYTAKKLVAPAIKTASPRVLIPVFPGTNCEYDTAKVFRAAGAECDIFVINNLTADNVARSVETFAKKISESQIVFIPGGFSGGDEPDGSGKFITAFFRNPEIRDGVHELLNCRDGLMGGICNGFQALVKLGLVPYGKIVDTDASMPTLTFNDIARHQSRLVRIRVASNKSPWFRQTNVGDVFTVAISHGEGKFVASEEEIRALAKNGQIATQYVDLNGNATYDIDFNPNGSYHAIEGITSPDGRVFGKMGHSERIGSGLYKNVVGEYDMKLFSSAVQYFKK